MKYPHLTTQSVVFNLQGGRGVGGNEVPYMATYANIYIRLSF